MYKGYAQHYTYDNLHRLINFQAGKKTEDGGVMNGVADFRQFRKQGWDLSPVGNPKNPSLFSRFPLL